MGEAILVKMRGGGGNHKPPEKWRFLQAFTSNGTFTMEKNKWYRVHVFGKSGDGGNSRIEAAQYTQSYSPGAGGGGAGGYAQSILMEKQATAVPITINPSLSSFGSYMTAYAGARGNDSSTQYGAVNKTGGNGGAGGTAVGGNIVNNTGGAGGRGGNSDTLGHVYDTTGAQAGARGGNAGGNGGAANYLPAGYNYSASCSFEGGGGGGGGRYNAPAYVGTMGAIGAGGYGNSGWETGSYSPCGKRQGLGGNAPPAPGSSSPPVMYGGGGGAGGCYGDTPGVLAILYGGTGQAGCIIIEVGAD